MAEAVLDMTGEEPVVQDTDQQQTNEPLVSSDQNKADPQKPEVKPAFPDDWREQLSGGDEKLLRELSRFTSPQMLVKSWKDTRTKISSGQYKTSLPDGATPEELAQWRQENGVPESWEKYDRDLGDGMVLGEEDKPIVDSFLQKMHDANMPASMAKDVLKWYYEWNDSLQQEAYERDAEFKETALEELRTEWGAEFKANINAVRSLVGDELGDLLFSARTETGERLGDHPAVLKFLAQTARELNPAATLVPSTSSNNLQTIEQEIAAIKKEIANPASSYWKDEAKQKRFQDLLGAQQKLSQR